MRHPKSNSLPSRLTTFVGSTTHLKNLRPHHGWANESRQWPARSLIALVLLITVGPPAVADLINHKELINQYDLTISKLERTIGAAKAHRTALMERMDILGNNLKHVATATEKTSVKNPTLQSELQKQKNDLAKIESLLQEKKTELMQQQEQSRGVPIPGVIADALADKRALDLHRELALWQYRIHLKKRNIETIARQKGELLSTITTTENRNNAVRSSIQKLTEQQQSLVNDKQSLEEKFASLSADIVKQQDRIERMSKRRRSLLDKPDNSMNFSKFRGSLPDPTEGILFKRYTEPKAAGLLKWEGILIKATLGQEIEAVFDGKVVFAGEIQGLGNVAIIDHDMDYMTLYGMAELLVIEEQQNVIAGQVIGTVGESIGYDASALYFEVRHNAETVNPEDWLSMQMISSDPTE